MNNKYYPNAKLIQNIKENFSCTGYCSGEGQCPDGRDKTKSNNKLDFNCKYEFETIKDNEERSSCNSNCERTYSYREYEKQSNEPRYCTHSRGNRWRYTNAKCNKCNKNSDPACSPDGEKLGSHKWKQETEICKPGEGRCPQDC